MRDWYENLATRERRMVLAGAMIAAILLVLAVVLPLNRNIAQAQQRITVKQGDLSFIQGAVPQLAGAGPGPGAMATSENIVVIVDSSARESGLGKSLASSQPTGDRTLRVRFERAPFDGLMAWLARISQNHGIRVDSAEIESAGEAGMVNAGLVLRAG